MFEIIENGTVTSPKGYLAGATNVGIKTDTDELDVGILWTNNNDAYCSGVFTRNSIVSHSVTASRESINGKLVKGVVANSGCANCGVGEQGLIDANEVIKLTSEFLGCDEQNLAICSTGLIGEELPMALIRTALQKIEFQPNSGQLYAKAMMTTDTKPKECSVTVSNWGRLLASLGSSKAEVDESKLSVYINDICILEDGLPIPFFKDAIIQQMVDSEITFRINLNLGESSASAWGWNLSEEYVHFNSAYTT